MLEIVGAMKEEEKARMRDNKKWIEKVKELVELGRTLICLRVWKRSWRSWDCRRIHLSNEHTYQVNSLIGLDLKLRKRALEDAPRVP